MLDLIKPNWPAPQNIKAFMTTRLGGYSQPPFDSLNLALGSGDAEEDVQTNRALLKESLDLPQSPLWLKQVHGNKIICADVTPKSLEADAVFAKLANKICVITTADCLPILITNTTGSIVCAVHAGWRSLAQGIIENAVNICKQENQPLLVWYGAAIGLNHYEVSEEFFQTFVRLDQKFAHAFIPQTNNKYLANLKQIATLQFQALGVDQIYDSGFDTYEDNKRFYSFRRDHTTGRFASLI
ncbi:MAG: peptidoglycan editing factor PgeF, partial [Pseudomonadota bacterium]